MDVVLDGKKLGKIDRMSLRPGDTVVMKLNYDLSAADLESIRRQLTEIFVGHRVLVLGHGTTLEVWADDRQHE